MKNFVSLFVLAVVLGTSALFANPVPLPPRMEFLHFDIRDQGTYLDAAFSGTYTIDIEHVPPSTLYFPIPENTTDFVVTEEEGVVPSTLSAEVYLPPLHPAEPQMAMWQWTPDFSDEFYYNVHVDYEQPVIPVGNSYLCFYALGCARHAPIDSAEMQVGMTIYLPDGYYVTNICLDNTPIEYETLQGLPGEPKYFYYAEIYTRTEPIVQDLYIWIAQGIPTHAASWEFYY